MDSKEVEFDNTSFVEDHFHYLPDELLLFIFNKIPDLKTLFHCSLVSKRFASVIYSIRSVSVTIPINEAYYSESCDESFDQSSHKLDLPIFLEKFQELESVHLEFTYPTNDDNSSLLRWKVNYESSTSMLDSIVAMLPVSVHEKSEFVPNQEPLTMENSDELFVSQVKDLDKFLNRCYREWSGLTHMLVKGHAKLRCVTITFLTNSGKQAKMVIGDKHLHMMRSDKKTQVTKFQASFAWVPELHLPLSGYVLRWVFLLVFIGPNESGAVGEIDDVIAWDFHEEEKVLGEAVREIFKNHRDKIHMAEENSGS